MGRQAIIPKLEGRAAIRRSVRDTKRERERKKVRREKERKREFRFRACASPL